MDHEGDDWRGCVSVHGLASSVHSRAPLSCGEVVAHGYVVGRAGGSGYLELGCGCIE